ncbi:MAG: ATP-binding protein, partial [Actinomycetota bacterium]
QIAELDDVRASLARRADLTRFALGLADAPELFDEIDFIMFLDEKKTITGLAGHGPRIERRGRFRRVPLRQADVISLAGSPVVDEALEQGVAATLAKVRDKAPILAAARVRHPRFAARTVGVVLVAHYVDARTVDRISANFDPASGSLIVDGRLVASGLRGDLTVRALLPGRVRPRLLAGETVTLEQTIGRGSFFSAISLLSNARGSPIEDVALLLSSPGEIVTQTRESVVQTLFLVALSAGLIALLLAWFSGRRIAQPIQMLTRTAQKVREGDLSARTNVAGEDEVGQLGETFNEMTSSLSRMTDDLREAAREEHRLRARIETIIQSMADALVAVDPQRKVLAFNREAEKLTGIKAKKAVGQPIDDVLDVRDAQGEPVTLPIQRLTEGSVGGVFIFRRGRDPIPVAVTSAVLRGEGDEPTGGVAVIRDMSREHELERMKTEFLANISHELRTPLTPIKGYAEILGRRDVSPEKTRQFVGGILESTGRLERIVGLLLDFSAMEAGKLSPRTAPVDIGAMLEEMASEWAHRAPRHEVVAEVATPLPKVIGDERLLRRSLEELLDNAVKFSPQGGKIRLQAKSASGNGRRNGAVEVTVEDQGIGISPEDLPKIFYDFHQLDGSETRTYGGLGLGLAFVQRIVKAHDGSVSVESRPEQGTRLTITIPAATRTGGED